MKTRIPVWYEDLRLGDLSLAGDGSLSFRYTDRWRATPGAFPISVTMPLRENAYPPKAVMPWLANLLPEETILNRLCGVLRITPGNLAELLLRVGGDTAGALSFDKPSRRSEWRFEPLARPYGAPDPQEALRRHIDDLERRPFLIGEEGVRQSLAGGQEKSALRCWTRKGLPCSVFPKRATFSPFLETAPRRP